MNFNSLFFPAPREHYSMTTHFGEMIYVPKDYSMVEDANTQQWVPILNSEKLLRLQQKKNQAASSSLKAHRRHAAQPSTTEKSSIVFQQTADLASLYRNRGGAGLGIPVVLSSSNAMRSPVLPKNRMLQTYEERDRSYSDKKQYRSQQSKQNPLDASAGDSSPSLLMASLECTLQRQIQKPPRLQVASLISRVDVHTTDSEGGEQVIVADANPEDVLSSPLLAHSSLARKMSPNALQANNSLLEINSYRSKEADQKSDHEHEKTEPQGPNTAVKHIPCLLIQKRVKSKSQKRELSVVNLLRSHMADLAKTYQLHQAKRDMPAPTATNMEMSPGKINQVSDEGSRQRANIELDSMKPSNAGHDQTKPTKIIVYFHGNAEDVGFSYELLVKMSITYQCSVLAVEYPGYGVYQTEQADAETIMINAQLVMQYLLEVQGYSQKDVILIGRSMGSGPACALAVEYPSVSALILLSPYTSLKQAVKTLLGTLASLIVRERFENSKLIRRVRCPTLIIHGQADSVIPESHAIELHQNCGAPSKLIMPADMTHNDWDMQKDLIKPIEQFFVESNVVPTVTEGASIRKFKQILHLPPAEIQEQASDKDREVLARLLKQNKSQRERSKMAGKETEQLKAETVMTTMIDIDRRPGCFESNYGTGQFSKADRVKLTGELLTESQSHANLINKQPLLGTDRDLIAKMSMEKSLHEAQAQLAATVAEYSVYHGRAPGPRQSLGAAPNPGFLPSAGADSTITAPMLRKPVDKSATVETLLVSNSIMGQPSLAPGGLKLQQRPSHQPLKGGSGDGSVIGRHLVK